MTIEEIKSKLCYYDKRHPDYVKSERISGREGCMCDNCFYGRHPLAEQLLQLLEWNDTTELMPEAGEFVWVKCPDQMRIRLPGSYQGISMKQKIH